ncbi:hypothetical protein BDP27DRAFT_1418926 [Rhodocollybia butyracea]|uniref:Uncharacterized protein n=1 Tax=Rhodocollybia butyracea TaxID=206335 RepID=A0A9P5PYG5_9AGAR|nr:hypothetical protein BDP27DRAFT_1418926 [Rhodocollybia butyracea]
MAKVPMTWRQFLHYRPTSIPTILSPSIPSNKTDTHTFTCTDTPDDFPDPTNFLRQSGLPSGVDFVSRIMNDFRSYAKGILDKNVPITVLDEIQHFERALSTRVSTDIGYLFFVWFRSATWITEALFALVDDGQGVIRVITQSPAIGDEDVSTLLDKTVVKASSVDFKLPLVFAFHLLDIIADHTFEPEERTGGRAMISKLFLKTKANAPANVGFFYDGELESGHWAAVLSQVCCIHPNLPTLPADFPSYLTGLDDIPFLLIFVYLLLPHTAVTEPKRPKVRNHVLVTITKTKKLSSSGSRTCNVAKVLNISNPVEKTTSTVLQNIQLSDTTTQISRIAFTRQLHHSKQAEVYQGSLDSRAVIFKIYRNYQHVQFCREVSV